MTRVSILKKAPSTSFSASVAKKVAFTADTKTQESQIYHFEYQRQSKVEKYFLRILCDGSWGHTNMQDLQNCEYCKASGQASLPHPDLPADYRHGYHMDTFIVPEQRDNSTFQYACKDCGTVHLSRKEINDHILITHPLSPAPTFLTHDFLSPPAPHLSPVPAYPVQGNDVDDDVLDYIH